MPRPQNSPCSSFRKRSLFFLILIGFVSAGCTGKNIHKELREDTGILVREWTRQTKTQWEAGERQAEYSNPVQHENTLVFGNQSTGLIALYPGINQIKWSLNIPNGVVSELSIDKESVYFGGGDGYLYSASLETGRVLWRYEVRNPIISRPTLKNGRLFVTTSDDTVYAFDAGSGQWLWHYRRRSALSSTILGASAPLVDGNEVIAGLSDGFLISLSVDDGKLNWEKRIHEGQKFTDVDAEPVLDRSDRGTDSGTIYVPSYDGALYALERKSGRVMWKFDAGGSKRVVPDGTRLFFPSSDGNIYCLQKENAKVLWKFSIDSGVPTQVVVTDKYVIAGSSYQYLYVLDKNSGEAIYRYNVGSGSGFTGRPLFDPERKRLYVLSGAGNLYAFSLRQPTRLRPHGKTDPYQFLPR